MGEMSRAWDAVYARDADAEAALYALIRSRVLDDALTAVEPVLDALEAEGRHVAVWAVRDALLRVRDGG